MYYFGELLSKTYNLFSKKKIYYIICNSELCKKHRPSKIPWIKNQICQNWKSPYVEMYWLQFMVKIIFRHFPE